MGTPYKLDWNGSFISKKLIISVLNKLALSMADMVVYVV